MARPAVTQSWTWLWPFLSMMHEACPASGGNSSVGTTSPAPTLKSRSSANGAASTTSLRLCHVGDLRLVVWRAHSAVSAGTATALATTRALSVAAPDIAWVNCLNIYFISGSPACRCFLVRHPPTHFFEPNPSRQVLARPEDGPWWRKSSAVKAKGPAPASAGQPRRQQPMRPWRGVSRSWPRQQRPAPARDPARITLAAGRLLRAPAATATNRSPFRNLGSGTALRQVTMHLT